ncbi:LysR substrate-binding domain-containing protein [Novosphingopyxis baekryungensis]|uniref:LysR substrate-binding domain-containing protein n=1 Tax=Novosphingopyxis baekryungensis TaxID=279369 RepID=UPI0003B50BB8|nr:LysR substrate-binding domain-containing protein [Novosphingopyxis baekryungensis]MAC11671.1 LysR family transcriptional regulator [Sphingorhabdus sp.]|tara:strand:+ start:3247 stop:4122 length:876 start_codon:yes stop_codon:yes gene_type:complete
MTLDQLRIFVGVAEREHMTRAAEALNITQSAVSAAIKTLEERHGVALFHRVGRRIELTEAGRLFLSEARAVLGRAASAERTLAEYGGLERGSLSLVASQTIAGYWLPPLLARFHKRYPGIIVQMAIGNSDQAAEQVHEGSAELGFVEGLIDDPALARWTVGHDELALVGAAPTDEPINAKWLSAATWVLREEGSGTRSTFEASLKARGMTIADLNVALTLPSNEAVRSATAAGAGYTVISTLVAGPLLASGKLHRLPFKLDPRLFYGLRHKERYRSKAGDALLELIDIDKI